LENAKSLISDKGVTAVCYNLLQDSQSFGTSDNEIHFITTDAVTPLGRADKLALSFEIAKQSRLLDKDSNE
jgi:phosphopantothenoylcysteine decarboxylase/phosphopantothenate--cysteine ligase